MMNSKIFWIICIVMFIIGILANILEFIVKKIYKKKRDTMANEKKAEK